MPDRLRKIFLLMVGLFILACQSNNAMIALTVTPIPVTAASTLVPQMTTTSLPVAVTFTLVPQATTTPMPTVLPTSANVPQTPPIGTRIHFLPNTVGWQTTAILPPSSTKRYIFAAFGGQQMNVSLSTNPKNSALLYIWSADGTVYTPTTSMQTWSGTLPANQDYYVEIRSASTQNITYHIDVEIPAFINPPTPSETP